MSKDFADRMNEAIGTIRERNRDVATAITRVYDGMSRDRQRALSDSLSQGSRFWAYNADKTTRRAQSRAIILISAMYDNLGRANIDLKIAGQTNDQIAYSFRQTVTAASGRAPIRDLDLNHMRGRMEMIGSLSNNNRDRPWFAQQFRLYDHFMGRLNRVNANRRGVYREALNTAGIISWAPNEPATNGNPDGDRRFDQFASATGACRKPNGDTITLNCWEALMYWAYRDGNLTVPQCKALYSNGSAGIEGLFGLETANPTTAQMAPGDILTYVNGGVLNHVAIYAGIHDGIPHLFHCLSTDVNVAGVTPWCPHFLSLVEMDAFYAAMYGPCTLHSNRPFWIVGASTHAYYQSL